MKERRKVTLKCTGDPITQQHMKDSCDVNLIVKRYTTPEEFEKMNFGQEYGYAPSESFTQAMQLVAETEQTFAQFPSAIRKHFQNKASNYLDASQDPSRIDEFLELGLIQRKEMPGIASTQDLSDLTTEAPETSETTTQGENNP